MQQVNKANHHRKQNTNFIFLLGDTSETNNRRARQQQNVVKDGLSEVSAFAANVANNEKHHLLEFAMRYFGEGRKKFDFPSFIFFYRQIKLLVALSEISHGKFKQRMFSIVCYVCSGG